MVPDDPTKGELGRPLDLSHLFDDMRHLAESLGLPGEDWSKTRFPHPLDQVDTSVLVRVARSLRSVDRTVHSLRDAISQVLDQRGVDR